MRPLIVVSIIGAAFIACSKGVSQTTAGNACDRKLLTSADVANVLGAPIVEVKTMPGDPQTCQFITAGFSSINVSLRPGLGDVTVKTWLDGKMPLPATPLSGVGDRAAWVSELTEVVATKANLLCDIQATLGRPPQAASQAKIGSLCNTIYRASAVSR